MMLGFSPKQLGERGQRPDQKDWVEKASRGREAETQNFSKPPRAAVEIERLRKLRRVLGCPGGAVLGWAGGSCEVKLSRRRMWECEDTRVVDGTNLRARPDPDSPEPPTSSPRAESRCRERKPQAASAGALGHSGRGSGARRGGREPEKVGGGPPGKGMRPPVAPGREVVREPGRGAVRGTLMVEPQEALSRDCAPQRDPRDPHRRGRGVASGWGQVGGRGVL